MEQSVDVQVILSRYYEAANLGLSFLVFLCWVTYENPYSVSCDIVSAIAKHLDLHQRVPIIHSSCLPAMEIAAEFLLRRNYLYRIRAPTVKGHVAVSMEETAEAVHLERCSDDGSSDDGDDGGSSMCSPVSDSSGLSCGGGWGDTCHSECPSECCSGCESACSDHACDAAAYESYISDILVRLRETLRNSVFPAIARLPTPSLQQVDPKEFYIILVIQDVLRCASHELHEDVLYRFSGMNWLAACVAMLGSKGMVRNRCFDILKRVYCDATGYDAVEYNVLPDDYLLEYWFRDQKPIDVSGLPQPFDGTYEQRIEDELGNGDWYGTWRIFRGV